VIALSAFALSVSLAHTFIDSHIGLHAPAPRPNAWPYQDIAHVASVIPG